MVRPQGCAADLRRDLPASSTREIRPRRSGVSDNAIVVNSCSKYFSMTGWRVRLAGGAGHLVHAIERLTQNFFISCQRSASMPLSRSVRGPGQARQAMSGATASRSLMSGLPAVGLDRFAPTEGAFYLYCDVAHLTNDSPRILPADVARRPA